MINLNGFETLAAAAFTLILGNYLQKVIPFAVRFNLPVPVIGGLVIALLQFYSKLHYGTAWVAFDTSTQVPLMVTFFASLGFSASLDALKRGGMKVVICLVACTILLCFQNLLGILLAKIFGIHPLFGVLTGSVALAGGPGTALAFAPDFEKAGLVGASALGLAAAMGGIVMGGLLGGPVSTLLIEKNDLHPKKGKALVAEIKELAEFTAPKKESDDLTHVLLRHVSMILLVMWAGLYLSKGIQNLGINLPIYIGSMIVAALIRNFDDKTNFFRVNGDWIEGIGNVALALFLAMAMMTLDLTKLTEVAGPLLITLGIQMVFLLLVTVTILFPISGKDYEAAVMAGGIIGFMLGTTANAMANMDGISRKYGPAPHAYLVIPLVGACFIDFTNAAIVTTLMNLLK